ncbi:MAG: threonylcarbamoyl-AMP synthase [Verrucomicrobiota bacterium]|nr:threonylcarbamoyl-AMP synthase [Verrucomicrobiota bacterium]
METEIAGPEGIERAIAHLKAGRPVAFPTETVYGLGAPLFSEPAVAEIFRIKKRPTDNPLIVHVAGIEGLHALCPEVPGEALALCSAFWPGPLTLVLPQGEKIPPLVSAGHPTIAIRMPNHPIALALIRGVGEPLVAPSANLSGRPSPTCAEHVKEDLAGRVSMILDGGPCEIGIESTVISLVDRPVLLRPGQIRVQEIEAVLGQKVALPSKETPAHSPGMKYRHYAPKAKVRLCTNRSEIKSSFVLSLHPQEGERLLRKKDLFASFREADRLGVLAIDVDCSPELEEDLALLNRLVRAAESGP